ncbi:MULTISPECIES: NAD-dependent epimerase/dehydratase family protein [Maribacter]|uniref:Nucleoside-diphosphate-sugar epimerase n=1 Tax=Maribacter dokdonensis TaxID=320912 RepID=A0A1H4LX11_9FLAO|nr:MULTISPECIES: NAD-dependent epimerase/dehydratase family protein [Maribacter]KSA15338.1 NAD-dependent epimerase/dehydratase [Maribacter dokdonensis DSW-8]SEB75107.1 Nucleoside-diphosphate-sugar epimerase [Maribacter dokdonensis]HAI39161.1 NAD-dependent epimerase [Maribacter sp.]|tara:strand:- start:2763 stop:3710 length:948 start_codon:yes stop_codon:yes gene_type:complete
MPKYILIIGACGQIGTELTLTLREKYGSEYVIASDIREGNEDLMQSGPFEILDATNYDALEEVIAYYEISEVYLMAAMLSATAEKFPMRAWNLNMNTLFNVLNLAKEKKIDKIFWPSSIAVFGPNTPKDDTPQNTIMEPSTVYGISKQSGERWCEYYFKKFDVDVRSIRYPGLISWKTMPGGGTTDYAVEIYHKALSEGSYTCFLEEDTKLPMMFMDDAIRATLQIMEAPSENIKERSAYNLAAMSFTPKEMAKNIKAVIPEFEMAYEPDFRQEIANSWPSSIDDSSAQKDWNWKAEFDLEKTTETMLENLKNRV